MSTDTMTAPMLLPLDVDEIVQLLAIGYRGVDDPARPDAEQVDLLTHALQCGDLLAERHADDLELQVAGLLHDLGHHVPLTGRRERQADHELAHGREGARLVRGILGDRVASLIELHVPAKRFLVTFDSQYAAKLSPASVFTLDRQGGRMTEREAAAFLACPDAAAALELRRADDDAKDPTRPASPLAAWRARLVEVATARAGLDRGAPGRRDDRHR